MILSFKITNKGKKTDFVDKILKGRKTSTIREDKKNRWRKGMKIHFATGLRSKKYNQFATGEVLEVKQFIKNHWQWLINGKILSVEQMQELAYKDGFDTLQEFYDWFGMCFEGKLIEFKVYE